MTKAAMVPPLTRKYEVIEEYRIVEDKERVAQKMKVLNYSVPNSLFVILTEESGLCEVLHMVFFRILKVQFTYTLCEVQNKDQVFKI